MAALQLREESLDEEGDGIENELPSGVYSIEALRFPFFFIGEQETN